MSSFNICLEARVSHPSPQTWASNVKINHMSACPYCKGSVNDERIVVCPSCETVHHEECWQSNDQFCSVYGCWSRDGSALGCPWCDEVYLYDDRTTCMNC